MEYWFILAYAVGTAFGVWMGFKSGIKFGADVTINGLCEGGFLRYRKLGNDFEIYKYDDEEMA